MCCVGMCVIGSVCSHGGGRRGGGQIMFFLIYCNILPVLI